MTYEYQTQEDAVSEMSDERKLRRFAEVPKCTSWLGHKFEGRYSEKPTGRAEIGWGWVPSDIERVLRACRIVTYERDVCVRCGATIDHHARRGR